MGPERGPGVQGVVTTSKKMSAEAAWVLGFTIDRRAAGCWYAYKGPRFAPTEGLVVETADETQWRNLAEELAEALRPFVEGGFLKDERDSDAADAIVDATAGDVRLAAEVYERARKLL